MRRILAFALTLGSVIPAFAQSNGNLQSAWDRESSAYREDLACWGESTVPENWLCDVDDYPHIRVFGRMKVTRHYDCPGGGWVSNYVCQDVCGVPYDAGIHCGVYTEPDLSEGGMKCGYRWAVVQCYR
jgi:hypothetical protein